MVKKNNGRKHLVGKVEVTPAIQIGTLKYVNFYRASRGHIGGQNFVFNYGVTLELPISNTNPGAS
jgi:hypothetical protein